MGTQYFWTLYVEDENGDTVREQRAVEEIFRAE